MKIAILGNPENRRVAQFVQSFKGKEPVKVLSFLELLQYPERLTDQLKGIDCLKIESCGENDDVFKYLLAWGADIEDHLNQQSISKQNALNLSVEKGLIQYSRQRQLGYRRFLQEVESIAKAQNCFLLNAPQAILEMSDKVKTHQLLAQNNIEKVPYLGVVESYEGLQQLIEQTGCKRIFLKLTHASSASGVMAYQRKGNQEILISSATLIIKAGIPKVYNSLKIKKYTEANQIRLLVDTLAKQYLFAERWIPKATFDRTAFDLRLVYIDGEVNHAVMRCSDSPMTNLHLGNKRGDLQSLKIHLGLGKWKEIQALAQEAVACFQGAKVAGVDILLTGKNYKPRVIEVNPFGDLLPNVFNDFDETTYQRELRYFCREMAEVKCILFDLDNTLIDRDTAFERYIKTVFESAHKQNKWEANKAEILEQDNHGFTSRDDFEAYLMDTFSIAPELLKEYMVGEFVILSSNGFHSLVNMLSTQYKVGVLSNGSIKNQKLKLIKAGFRDSFDKENIFISQALGCAKPDQSIFRKVKQQLQLSPEEILLIGDDSINDIKGGIQAGWRTCHFEYKEGVQVLIEQLQKHNITLKHIS